MTVSVDAKASRNVRDYMIYDFLKLERVAAVIKVSTML